MSALLVAAAASMYATRLSFAPIYLIHDEVKFALHAQSVADSGRDLNGRRWPVYFSEPEFIAGRDPLVIYATAAVLKVLPLSESAVRLPTALVGVLNVLLIFVLAKRLFKNDLLAVAAAAMLAFSPGHFIHSRMALSVLYPIPFVILWLIGLEDHQRNHRRVAMWAAGFALGLAGYGYLAGLVMMPVYVLLTGLLLANRRSAPAVGWLVLGVAVSLIPMAAWHWIHPERYSALMGAYRVGGAVDSGVSHAASLLSYEGARLRLGQWWAFFNPEYLFLSGDTSMTNSTRGAGLFPLAFAVFLPVGVYQMWRATPMGRTIVCGLVTAPLAAVLTGTLDLNRYRALLVLPFGVLTATAGVEALWNARWRGWHWAGVLLLATIPFQFWGFYADYMGPYRRATSVWFGRNLRGALVEVLAHVDDSQTVLLSNRVPYIDAYWRFFARAQRRHERVDRFTVVDPAGPAPAAAPSESWLVCGVDDSCESVLSASAAWRLTHTIAEPDGMRSFLVFHKTRD